MKKLNIISVILILFLTFTLIGDCAWLDGWDYRIEISLDYDTYIAGEVTWFPVTIFLKDANGDSTKVFLEVGANSRKIAITKADGTTELKGEIEQWEYDGGTPALSVAVIHTSATGWTINANTSVFLYYDVDHGDNPNIDVINTVAGAAVWDGDFVAVHHMADATISTVLDSTSNNNDGTKTDDNQPPEAAGKVGQGQDFDGDNDLIDCGNATQLDGVSAFTIEYLSYIASLPFPAEYQGIVARGGSSKRVPWVFGNSGNSNLYIQAETTTAGADISFTTNNLTAAQWQHIAFTWDGSTCTSYIDSVSGQTDTSVGDVLADTDGSLKFGFVPSYANFDGLLDEIRISVTNRSVAWIKGTYNSLWDSLLTYGSEEERPTDWLAGWSKRIELKIEDYAGDIGASVTWFPVTVFLTATQAEEVFAELTTDAEYLKVAVTKADKTTELYAEFELFDVSETKGIFHTSIDGWTINADTSIFLYYDSTHAENTTYIGAIGARTEVWDNDFDAVYHMVDETDSTVADSTSNDNDITKRSSDNPLQATGHIGQGQDFSSDYMTHPTFWDTMPTDLTVEMCIKADTIPQTILFYKHNIDGDDRIALQLVVTTNKIRFWGQSAGGSILDALTTNTVNAGTWYYIAGVHTSGSALKVYLNDAEDTGGTLGTVGNGTFADAFIGASTTTPSNPFDGTMDEVRFSSTPRTASWLKGTKNTLWDDLLTYGSEETSEVEPTYNYYGHFIK